MSQTETPVPEQTLLRTLADISTVAAALSFGVLSVAFIHEWGYFGVVGRSFQSLMSPADYVGSAVAWLPWAVAMMLIGYLIEHFTRRTEGFRSEAEIAATFPSTQRWWWTRQFPWVLGRWASFFNAALVLAVLNIYQFGQIVALGLTALWYAFLQWYLTHPRIAFSFTDRQRSFLTFAPVIGIWVFIVGQSSGYLDLARPQRTVLIKMKKDDAEHNVILLRTLGAGLLTRDPGAARVSFTKWDELSSFSLRVQLPDNRSYLCLIWERMCFNEQKGPNP